MKQNSDNRTILDLLRCKAKNGNIDAQVELAEYLENDKNSQQECLMWLNLAANKAHPKAQYLLGIYYDLGYYVQQDKEKAFNLYSLSAKQGYINAQYQLGFCYEFGVGTQKNSHLAKMWLEKAASQNHLDALCAIGDIYIYEETTENDKKAISYWIKAAQQGHASSMLRLGNSCLFGWGVRKNLSMAIKWYTLSAECGCQEAQKILKKIKKHIIHFDEAEGIDNNLEELNMYHLLENFKSYCKTPGINSGKAQSYANAIQYVCDFLGVKVINQQVVSQLKKLEVFIYNYNSEEYNNLLSFLDKRKQKSYLTGGFIKAALKYFYPFWEQYKNI